jgi:Uncharacterized conserved protein, contains RING Zn-finger
MSPAKLMYCAVFVYVILVYSIFCSRYCSSYDYLRDHFRSEHFLCEEGGCIEEKFTSVFRTEIDLKGKHLK